MACAKQAKPMGFASIMTVGEGAVVEGNKHHNKGKGKKRAEGDAASMEAGVQPYTPVKLPLSK